MKTIETAVELKLDEVNLQGTLNTPPEAKGVVLFAHGSGSSRFSPRNRQVAQVLNQAGLATFLMDLLSPEEELEDEVSGHLRFNIPFLAERVSNATEWLEENPSLSNLSIGYFGASTGAGAALLASTQRFKNVRAIVSRGGRPDLVGQDLSRVEVSTLFIVGSRDPIVLKLNQESLTRLASKDKRLHVIEGASHLFEEPGALEKVAQLSAEWFEKYL